MKRKFFALLSLGILMIFMFGVISAYAADNNNNIRFVLTESDENKIVDFSLTADISAIKESQQKVSEGYYSYTLVSPDIVTSVKKGTEIKNIISKNYCLVVPTEKGYIKYLKDTNGDISYVGDVIFNESSKNTNIVNISAVKNILSTAKFSDATDVVVLDVPMYQTSFVSFSANNEEYLIPFSSRPNFTGLENGKVYKVTDCITILSATWESASADGDDLSNGNGGPAGSFSENSSAIIFEIMIAVLFMALALILTMMLAKNKQRTMAVQTNAGNVVTAPNSLTKKQVKRLIKDSESIPSKALDKKLIEIIKDERHFN